MKNFNRVFSFVVVVFVFIAFVILPESAYSQKKTEQQTLSAFPDSISSIIKNSCVACHSDQSNSKAKIFMNLSDWDQLKPAKQAKIAMSISKMVSKGAMPPSGFLKKMPETTLNQEQVKTLVLWANSLKN